MLLKIFAYKGYKWKTCDSGLGYGVGALIFKARNLDMLQCIMFTECDQMEPKEKGEFIFRQPQDASWVNLSVASFIGASQCDKVISRFTLNVSVCDQSLTERKVLSEQMLSTE